MQAAIQHGQRLTHGVGHEVRQAFVQTRPLHAGVVARAHRAAMDGRATGEEVAHGLGGRGVVAAARGEGRLLPFSLEAHAGQRVVAAEVLGRDGDQQRRVGVFAVAGEIAHAVDRHAALLAGRGYHRAAGAHAEGVGSAAVGQMDAQLVVRRAQRRMIGRRAVLGAVDHRLAMLDARADGEGLARHGHVQPVEHFEGVPGAVAHGENHVVREQRAPALGALQHRARDAAVLDFKADQLCLKADRAAQREDLPAQIAHHLTQMIGAHVGLGHEENLLRRAHAMEGLQHMAAAGILDARIELAVGERARAALAELDVALRLQRAAGPEGLHVPGALVHGLAALDDHGLQPRLRKPQRGE